MTSDTPVSGSKRRAGRASPPIRRARMSFKTASCLVLLCLACLLVPVAARRKALQTNPPSRPAGIIATDGGRFVDPSDGSTFHVAGANCYYLAYSSGAEQGSYEHDWVAEVLAEAVTLKLNVLRIWTFQDQWWEKERALQSSPGEYNERFLVGLDTLISQASTLGIRLLLCLSNYWEDYGGAMAYVKWAHATGETGPNGEPLRHREDFFTSNMCRDWFKKFISKMLSRTNTVTGLPYRDDPSIFAWELINEPRVMGDSTGDILQNWIEEMAVFAKGLDEKHLLTVGTEGFYGQSDSEQSKSENPVGGAEKMGSDFTRNFLTSSLDFASVHMWVDLWLFCDEVCKLNFAERWIAGHLEVSRDGFDKPVILEEFGKWKPLEVRDAFFQKSFEVSLPPTSPVSSHAGGSLFWHMDPANYPYNEDGFSVQAKVETDVARIVKAAAQNAYDSDTYSTFARAVGESMEDFSGSASETSTSDVGTSTPSAPSNPPAQVAAPSNLPAQSYSSSPTSSSPDSGTDPEKPVVYMSPSAHSHGAGSDAPGAIPRYKFDSVPTSGAPARQDTDVDKEPEG